MRQVLAARAAGDEHADLAIGVHLHRLRRRSPRHGGVISPETARTRVLLIEAREDVEIAHQVDLARAGVTGGGSRG